MGEINITYLLQLAWHRIWALIMAAAVFAIAAMCYCEFLAVPQYSAVSSVIVTNGSILIENDKGTAGVANPNDVDGTVNGTDVSASLSLANTVVDIISSNNFYSEVADSLNKNAEFAKFGKNKYTYSLLAGMVKVSRRNSDTMSVDITVSSSNSDETVAVASAVAEYAKEYIIKYIPQSKTEVLDKARVANKTFPRTAIITIAAAVVGAALAFLMVFIIDSLNQTIRGEEEFIAKYDMPLLGSVPDFENVEVVGSYKIYKTKDGGYQ